MKCISTQCQQKATVQLRWIANNRHQCANMCYECGRSLAKQLKNYPAYETLVIEDREE